MLYEVLVTAQFPVRTFVEVLLFTIIWSFTTAYWNRRT
jgi:hypothetical protein